MTLSAYKTNNRKMNKKNIKLPVIFSVLVSVLGFVACNDAAWEKHTGKLLTSDKNIYEVIAAQPELSKFASLLKKTGYAETLQSSNSFTVFAPQNTAWTGIDTANIESLRKKIGMLIVYNTYFSDNENLLSKLSSVNGKNIFYDAATQTFNGAKIISADIPAANGAIQITDILIERKENIWDYVSTLTTTNQFLYINGLNKKIMDEVKSVAVGVYPDGKTKYDTVWKNINNFLQKYPLENEDSIYTYLVVENTGFDMLFNKYRPYFKSITDAKTDSITNFNVCQDFVFRGVVDITKFDTLTNVDNVKVPVAGVTVKQVYNASNGRVYVINESNIRLKDKVKPIMIEGEKFNKAYDVNYVFTRYKRWASGERDVVLSSGETQADTLWHKIIVNGEVIKDYTGLKDSVRKDSVVSKTYFINSNLVANVANFYIEYKTQVNSANYDVYYVAYDDISDHFDHTYTRYGVYNVVQKLFISMPGAPALKHGTPDNTRGVANNYLGELRCFVGQTKAGIYELTKLKQWNLQASTQIIDSPVNATSGEIMTVPRTGTMTLWLCNTARSNAASRQGLLFLDYILLVPRITE